MRIATESLLLGDADVVVVGGVSYHLIPEYYVALGLLGALSTRGGRPFHSDADGFVPAEAAGALVLKRLSDARRANDHVYAVIAGHGVSSDGYGLSIYSPSSDGQRLAMSRAFAAAGMLPTQVDLVEAHGPGSPLGDSTEMASIASVYGERPFLPPVSVAAAKSLVGHSSSAGAMLSIIRAALALASKVIPSSGGNGALAPNLPFDSSIELSLVARPWTSPDGRRRRAAVSAFGMTGINHHVLLEEADSVPFRDDVPNAAIEHPATRPAQALVAERFVIVDTPVALPERQPLFRIQGRTLALVVDRGSFWKGMETALCASGARVLRLELPLHASEQDVCAALGHGLDIVDGIIDLSTFGACTSVQFASDAVWSELKAQSDRTFALLRALYERLASSRKAPGWYVAVTSVRGQPGVADAHEGNPLGAFLQGLARALKQEIPDLVCKAIDLDPLTAPVPAIAAIVREIEDGNDRVDVRISDRRYVSALRRANFPDTARSLRGLKRGDVFL
ncbi:MAG TPA: beta-ketoacyl synthase N-terminal-like domain-containing protein, partial [Polyangiaceae bacterium]